MFDKRHYQNDPTWQKHLDALRDEEELMAATPDAAQEEIPSRVRKLGRDKSHNARGRQWWNK